MSIKNYTTTVSAFKTIAEIEEFLAGNDCAFVQKQYENREPIGLSFTIFIKPDQPVNYRLPVNWKSTLKIFERDPKITNSMCTKEQASKTSWRIVKDWIVSQIALIQTGAVTMEQVFLPYMVVSKNGKTLFDAYLESGPKLLEGSK